MKQIYYGQFQITNVMSLDADLRKNVYNLSTEMMESLNDTHGAQNLQLMHFCTGRSSDICFTKMRKQIMKEDREKTVALTLAGSDRKSQEKGRKLGDPRR